LVWLYFISEAGFWGFSSMKSSIGGVGAVIVWQNFLKYAFTKRYIG
jgi:hypothetical protein